MNQIEYQFEILNHEAVIHLMIFPAETLALTSGNC